MEYTNEQLYTILQKLNKEILTHEELIFPATLNFYIQKNKNLLLPLVEEIENVRIKIVSSHGDLIEDSNQYKIREDEMDEVVAELNKLFSITQTVNFYTCGIELLKDVPLTMAQMDALMFMVKEETV